MEIRFHMDRKLCKRKNNKLHKPNIVTKIDEQHKDFIGKVLCSKGIGAEYIKRDDAKKHTYKSYRDWETDRKSTRLNSSHITRSRMPSSA